MYSRDNPKGLGFVYYPDEEHMRPAYSVLSVRPNTNYHEIRKNKQRLFEEEQARELKVLREYNLANILLDYEDLCATQIVKIDDPFFRSYKPFVEPDEVRKICGVCG